MTTQTIDDLIRRYERILPDMLALALAFPGTFHERDYLADKARLDALYRLQRRVAA